jgi:hypothetical protein
MRTFTPPADTRFYAGAEKMSRSRLSSVMALLPSGGGILGRGMGPASPLSGLRGRSRS